jgi:alkaline phosphatase
MKRIAVLTVLVLGGAAFGAAPRYVILFIGSGMGYEAAKAASIYAEGVDGTLNFQKFPFRQTVAVKCAEPGLPDAASAASAIAIGFEVNRGVLSMRIPGDGKDAQTVLEYNRDRLGKSAGLVTDSFLTDATVAAFAAHAPRSTNYEEIAEDYLKTARPEVLLGGGGCGMAKEAAEGAGYTVVASRSELQAATQDHATRICGLFGDGAIGYAVERQAQLPSLAEMTEAALRILERDPDGFFLVVNASNIGRAARKNDLAAVISEVLELQRAVQMVLDWAREPNEALVLVTGDVDIGGLTVTRNNGRGKEPEAVWTAKDITERKVTVWARGANASRIQGIPDTRYLCQGAVDEPDIRPVRSRWKNMVVVGLLAIMAVMMILARGGSRVKDL